MSNSQMIAFSITVPGKVILYGEHSVVYGKTALAASLNLKTKLEFKTEVEGDVPKIILDFPCIELDLTLQVNDLHELFKKQKVPLLHEAPHRTFSLNSPDSIDFNKLLAIVESFLKSQKLSLSDGQESAILSFLCLFWGMFSSVDVPLPSCLIKITSELDIGSGMGSSTAYNISLAAAFLQYIRRCKLHQLSDPHEISKEGYKNFKYWTTDLKKFEKEELELISKWGHIGDKIMHGNPSGIDNAVCTYGSFIEFRKGSRDPDINIIPDPKLLKILLVNTKVPRDTKILVSRVASLKGRFTCIVDPILQAMDFVALSAAEVLRRMSQMCDKDDHSNNDALEKTLSKEIEKLEDLIDVNQKLLESLGVSHDSIERVCRIAKSEGLHGKLTGAGGGGYVFVILPMRGYEKPLCAVKMIYEKHQFPVQQVTLGGPGVSLVDVSFSNSDVAREDSALSIDYSVTHVPSHEGDCKKAASISKLMEQNVQSKDEEVDEWPWPLDLRNTVKKMFETHIKEDLQVGEIAIPLKSLCAVNVPEPLPQWMDKVTKLQASVDPTWRNVLQRGPSHRKKTMKTMENEERESQHGSTLLTQTKPQIETLDETVRRSMKPQIIKTKYCNQMAPVVKGSRTNKQISNMDSRENESIPKPKPIANAKCYIPKQASYRENLYGELDCSTKWLKDQFVPYGKREWTYGANFDESARQLQILQRRHTKFLRQQKPGCAHFRNMYQNED